MNSVLTQCATTLWFCSWFTLLLSHINCADHFATACDCSFQRNCLRSPASSSWGLLQCSAGKLRKERSAISRRKPTLDYFARSSLLFHVGKLSRTISLASASYFAQGTYARLLKLVQQLAHHDGTSALTPPLQRFSWPLPTLPFARNFTRLSGLNTTIIHCTLWLEAPRRFGWNCLSYGHAHCDGLSSNLKVRVNVHAHFLVETFRWGP
jgi:hypothetical protein